MRVDGFLKHVIDLKKLEVEQSKRDYPIKKLRKEAETAQNNACFLSALERNNYQNIGIIAEIKKASPSKGDIKPDLDPVDYAHRYTKAGACAVSVLTEPNFFKGSLKDLEKVCQATDLPVLRKDFTISSYQIYEARKTGAASVLFITSILSNDQLKDYIALARELDMEPLIEIVSERELEKAYNCNAKIIGINNRNLQTLETDLEISKRIGPVVPKEMICIEASGISSRADIENGIRSNIFSFLVGESIVRADDTVEFIKNLMTDLS